MAAVATEEAQTEPEVATVATDGPPATWRDTPVKDFLDVPEYLWAAPKRHHVVTAGDLFNPIAKGCRFGQKDTTVRDLLHEVQARPGFDGRMQEAAEGPAPPKPGTVPFDGKAMESPFGQMVRLLVAAGNHHGAKDTPEFNGLHRLLSEFHGAWDGWAKKLTKKEAA